MKFRTETGKIPSQGHQLDHDHRVLMLGSCFTDNIGSRLSDDGFDVVHNPLGALYNPESIATCLLRALGEKPYCESDLYRDDKGIFHCLDYANRYQGPVAADVAQCVNNDLALVTKCLTDPKCNTLIITFGSAWVYYFGGKTAGNCHKLPGTLFERNCLDVDRITRLWTTVLQQLPPDIRVIFTVSPIRHLADGLHGNQISKATLLLAIDRLCGQSDKAPVYFPSYEIMLDDLRDYRFYAADMKHPSETAIDYIYELFSDTFFCSDTQALAIQHRKAARAALHRPIL